MSYTALNIVKQTEQIPNVPPRMGAKSMITSNHPSTPYWVFRFKQIFFTHIFMNPTETQKNFLYT